MKILVLEASALHLGFLGCYGNDWVATPNLDRLAAEGVVFDQHLADWTAPPTPSVQRRIASLPGFATEAAGVIEDWLPGAEPLLWLEGPDLAPPWQLPDDLLTAYCDEDDEEAEPLHEVPLGLSPLDVDAMRRLQDTYAAAVTFFDAQFGVLLDSLREEDLLDQLLLVVTARHGLPLGEHGVVGVERAWLYSELIHLPLLLRLPGAAEAGSRVPALTQPADLLPTFLDFLGLPPPADLRGHSLRPLLSGEVVDVRPYACSHLHVGDSEEWLLRTPDWAFLLPTAVPEDDRPRRPQLYVKSDDRWEVNDLSQRYPEDAERLEATLRQFIEAQRQPGPLRYPPLQATADAGESAS